MSSTGDDIKGKAKVTPVLGICTFCRLTATDNINHKSTNLKRYGDCIHPESDTVIACLSSSAYCPKNFILLASVQFKGLRLL